jgi:hypothetical protein
MARTVLILLAAALLAAPVRAGEEEAPAPVVAWAGDLATLPPDTTWLVLAHEVDGPEVPVLTNEDLAVLVRLEHLRVLDLGRAGLRGASPQGVGGSRWDLHLTDEGLAHLARIPSLRELRLPAGPRITDAGLAALACGLPSLRVLSVPWWGAWGNRNDATLASLAKFRALEELDLTGSAGSRDAEWAERIAEVVTLRRLSLDHCRLVRGGWLAPLARLPALGELSLAGVEDADLAPLAASPALRTLRISRSPALTDAGLEPVGSLGGLTSLELDGCGGVASLAPLAPLHRLERLVLRGGTALTDEGLAAVAGLKALTSLDLSGCRSVTDAGVAHLVGLPRLAELDLGGRHLGGSLRLEPVPIADAGLAQIARIASLRRLNLSGFHAEEWGCRTVQQGPIVLDFPTRFTDEGLRALARLPTLESLSIATSREITEAGLAWLGQVRTLVDLDVRGCPGLTREAVRALRTALPGCRVRDG